MLSPSIQEGRSGVRGCRRGSLARGPSYSAVNLLHSPRRPSPFPPRCPRSGGNDRRPLPPHGPGGGGPRRGARVGAPRLGRAELRVALAGLLARAWPRGVRWVLVAAAVAAVGLVAERIWRHWTRAAGNPFRAARLVARACPVSRWTCSRCSSSAGRFRTIRRSPPELALAHVRAVDARTAHLDAQAVVDRAAVRRAGLSRSVRSRGWRWSLPRSPTGCAPRSVRCGPPPAPEGSSLASRSPPSWRCSTSTPPTPASRRALSRARRPGRAQGHRGAAPHPGGPDGHRRAAAAEHRGDGPAARRARP